MKHNPDRFDIASAEWRADLIALLTALQKDIGDDYRATDDELSDWAYQTGDNSYTGGCYSYPYWGLGSISRDDDPADVADALLDDLGETWSGGQF
jgi:hypothetical protein